MTFKYRVIHTDAQHVHVTLFAGPDEHHLVHSGTLILHPTEWPVFMAMQADGAPTHADLIIQT